MSVKSEGFILSLSSVYEVPGTEAHGLNELTKLFLITPN